MNFFLEIDADGPAGANDLVGTTPVSGGDIAAGISDANISWIVANGMMGSLDSGGNQRAQELLMRSCWRRCLRL